MANYNTSANVVLTVNGKQAQQMFSSLEKDAKRLEKGIAKAASAGDKATMKKLQRELNSTHKMMEQLRGTAFNVDNTLRRLDKATPKELNKALRQLQQQLNGIQRGTTAWDAHVAKIKAVKEELQRVNEAMSPQRSMWERMNIWLNNCQTALLGIGAAVTGLVLAGRKAVNAYAEMEQEMANVRKFTGMTAEEVEALNKEFKKIDTRTSREELNRLAQEAGRLGKSSQEDVLGFVRAADKINVALDDLGEGATLTLSKLTGIFGDEKRLGTEKSLLAVGSVINELSQNCSASAPYLAEFASRMGGVGSQAGMTVQQIMGFAAVLDSNNQKLEASSTALSQVIVRIYQDPAKYARVAGMDVQRFSELVKTDMNAALIEFLSTLKQAGSMDVLSPMFKDMGENGSRAISALSTLAGHIEEVKSQQLVANEAFEEATSIDKEFNVQNNTVQAGLEKAKKRVTELAVELGQKLQPVMRFVMSSTSVALNVLSAMVNFFIKYKAIIFSVVAALVAYKVALVLANAETRIMLVLQKGLNLIMGAGRIVALAVAAAYNTLAGHASRAAAANRALNTTLKNSGWGAIVALIGLAVGALISYVQKMNDATAAERERRAETERRKKEMIDYTSKAVESYSKEITALERLYKAAVNEAKSKQERIDAAKQLLQLYPDAFRNFSAEEIMLGKAKDAYDKLTNSIINNAKARAAAELYFENQKELLKLELEMPALEKEKKTHEKAKKEIQKRNKSKSDRMNDMATTVTGAMAIQGGGTQALYEQESTSDEERLEASAQAKINENKRQQAERHEALDFLEAEYGGSTEFNKTLAGAANTPDNNKTPDIPISYTHGGAGGNVTGGGGDTGYTDKFAAEKEWRERQEALARISYATGETDYIAHTNRMNEIAVEFYEKQLQHTDLTETERLKITADWREAQKKQDDQQAEQAKQRAEQEAAAVIEAENNRYSERIAQLKQFYLDGSISKETYDLRVEEAEIEHQYKLVKAAKEGSKERLQAEQRLQDLMLAQMQRRQQEREQLEAKYAAMKKDYFGDNPKEAQAKYDADLALLQVVYGRELQAAGNNAAEKLRIEEAFEKAKLALKKKYGLLNEKENRNAMEKTVSDFADWLESDGGKALTGSLDTLVSGMSAVFSQLSSLMQAELEIQTAAINKRYDAEISRAEGNSYTIKKLEKDKEREIAKAKNEANRKMFAMQVIQAVAQTAQNALNAYGSAAAIPVVGYILAPIAAAMAVAAGAIQIAAIKKQQQASEAQGYESGGFTPEGKPDEVAGVVHKGEWVASQRLVNNPRTRPLLEALDYAQRTNTIGSITNADVSRSITAPMVLASQPAAPAVVNNTYSDPKVTDALVRLSALHTPLSASIARLNDRLNEPFVTVNTVSGDYGIKKAQDDYNKLMRNKSPKSRK